MRQSLKKVKIWKKTHLNQNLVKILTENCCFFKKCFFDGLIALEEMHLKNPCKLHYQTLITLVVTQVKCEIFEG